MTIREYFKREKHPVEKYLIQRAGKATIVVPEAEKKQSKQSRWKSIGSRNKISFIRFNE